MEGEQRPFIGVKRRSVAPSLLGVGRSRNWRACGTRGWRRSHRTGQSAAAPVGALSGKSSDGRSRTSQVNLCQCQETTFGSGLRDVLKGMTGLPTRKNGRGLEDHWSQECQLTCMGSNEIYCGSKMVTKKMCNGFSIKVSGPRYPTLELES